MASNRVIEFSGYKICINDQTYEPAEDTLLLLGLIDVKAGEVVLDMGSGSGILGLHSLKLGASKVIFIDINPFATEATLCTLRLNGVSEGKFDVINCDLLSCLRNGVNFDVAIFNPPYLPYEEYDSWIEYSWSGGRTGVDVLERFLQQINAKRIYIVFSSLSDFDRLFSSPSFNKYKIGKRKEITIGFETITGMELVSDD